MSRPYSPQSDEGTVVIHVSPPPMGDTRSAADDDDDSDRELRAASISNRPGSSSDEGEEEDEEPRIYIDHSANDDAPSSAKRRGHLRTRSAMKIFDSEFAQSFADLESRMRRPSPTAAQAVSAPISPVLDAIEEDLPQPPNALTTRAVSGVSSITSPSSVSEGRDSASASISSSASTPPSPLSTPARLAPGPGTTPSVAAMMQRRGSDFRKRAYPTLTSALSPLSPNGTLSKSKCLMPDCTSFSSRNQYCLRHVWRLSVEELEPVNQQQYQVAKEFVTTEKSYSDGLRVVYKSFLLRIATQKEMAADRFLLGSKDMSVIFHNIEDIYRLAENLYLDLEEITLEKVLTTQIGTTLLHYAPQFRIYQTYLENYDDAIKKLGQVRKDNADFDFFCRLQERCEGMSLESFLIMPVQRLPRYLLLLQELLKRSESATNVPASSLADMHLAKEKISNIAASINMSLHQKEAQKKVVQIQNRFERDQRYQDIATPTRYLVREGPLKKRYGKGSRHFTSSTVYHFFLFNDILLYADFKKDVLGRGVTFKLKHIIPLIGMTVEPTSSKGKDKDFIVTPTGSTAKSFDLSCADTNDRDSWVHDIRTAIDKLESEARMLKTTSFDGTSPAEKAGKSSKLKAIMGV